MILRRVSELALRMYSQAMGVGSNPGVMKIGSIPAPKEGSCGIPPWDPKIQMPPPPKPMELPAHLIRPPCLPGSTPGEVQTCLRGVKGLYCPPCRIKYKYPPFSDNIDFVPPAGESTCWWKSPLSCPEGSNPDPETLRSLTRGWDCNLEFTPMQ